MVGVSDILLIFIPSISSPPLRKSPISGMIFMHPRHACLSRRQASPPKSVIFCKDLLTICDAVFLSNARDESGHCTTFSKIGAPTPAPFTRCPCIHLGTTGTQDFCPSAIPGREGVEQARDRWKPLHLHHVYNRTSTDKVDIPPQRKLWTKIDLRSEVHSHRCYTICNLVKIGCHPPSRKKPAENGRSEASTPSS